MLQRVHIGGAAAAVAALGFVGCAGGPSLPEDSTYGPNPTLPAPQSSSTTVDIAPAKGWAEGEKPVPGAGLTVASFAEELDHPRWIYVLPNGDVLVAETNAPTRPEANKGIKGYFKKLVQKRAGAAPPSANRITLLRDADGDGTAEVRNVFLANLNSPFGMALVGNDFYVANTDAIMRFPYRSGATSITESGTKVADLPAGPINSHWTKNLLASPDGKRLYVTVGSNSNVAERGMENEDKRAAILEVDIPNGTTRVFASGLRNPNGLDWQPESGELWAAVNERDEIGNDLVPDYITSVKEGGFYGWPYSYYGQNVDERVEPQRPELVAKAIKPDYATGAHTATLGLVFNRGELFPERYQAGAFVGQHGSWNRKPLSGYQVIFIPFENGRPSGKHEPVLTGFVDEDEQALGRPVGVAIDQRGALLVADDVGNRIWRVTPAGERSRVSLAEPAERATETAKEPD
jgi:glucose/arabinose dehydrogenase